MFWVWPEDPAPIYRPNSCGAGGAKYKGLDSRLRGNDNVVVPTTAKQEPRNNTYGIKLRG